MAPVTTTLVRRIACLCAIVLVQGGCAMPPKPMAWVLRAKVDHDSREVQALDQKLVPPGVTSLTDLRYADADPDERLDVHYPTRIEGSDTRLPTVVWVHGGGWIAGSKDFIAPYLQIIASHGYTVVGVNYTLSPEAQYPVPVRQVNTALAWLIRHADTLHVDTSRIVLAGDSAGGHIATQIANLTVSPDYAKAVGIESALAPEQLSAMLLTCGTFGFPGGFPWPYRYYVRTLLLSYFGTEDLDGTSALAAVPVQRFLTDRFPPAFITAGNDDPLEFQSRGLADKLTALGVKTDTLFFAPTDEPKTQHDFQFDLGTEPSQRVLQRLLAFLEANVATVSAPPSARSDSAPRVERRAAVGPTRGRRGPA
jgi:acetyl esterase/lipase